MGCIERCLECGAPVIWISCWNALCTTVEFFDHLGSCSLYDKKFKVLLFNYWLDFDMDEDRLKSRIAYYIKKYRNTLKMSEAEFSEKIGVTRVTVSDWEREAKLPDLLTLARIARTTTMGYSLASDVLDLILERGGLVEGGGDSGRS